MPSPFDPSNFDPAEFRRQSFNNALAEMGRSLVQAGSSSPTPVGFAQGLGMGMGGFNQGMQAGQGQAIQRYLLSLEIAKKKREEAAARQQARAQAMLTGGVDPSAATPIDWQAMSEADPRWRGTAATAFPNAAPALFATRDAPQRSATERMIDARNRLLMKKTVISSPRLAACTMLLTPMAARSPSP